MREAENFAFKNELCVFVTPIFDGTKSHLVVLDGHRHTCVRGGFQLLQEQAQRLSIAQVKDLEPEFDDDGYIKDFKSPSDTDFTLLDKVNNPQFVMQPNFQHPELREDITTHHMTHRIDPGSNPANFDQSKLPVTPTTSSTSAVMIDRICIPAIPDFKSTPSSKVSDIQTINDSTSNVDDNSTKSSSTASATSSIHSMSTRSRQSSLISDLNLLDLQSDLEERVLVIHLVLYRHRINSIIAYCYMHSSSGTGKEEYVSIDVNLYGFRDAPRTGSDKIDKTLSELGYVQSSTASKVFVKRRGLGAGAIVVSVQTDDGLIAYTDNDEGEALLSELFGHLEKVYTITKKYSCTEFAGVQISTNENNSISLTQPSQVVKIQQYFFPDGEVPETFLPLPTDWSIEASNQATLADTKEYQSALGLVGYLRITMCESNTFSILASRNHKPSTLDRDALQHFAAFIITRKNIGITFHRSRVPVDINKCIDFHFFSDASPNYEGAGQIAWICKMGPPGHPGGAFIAKSIKQPGLVADSVPVLELEALHHGSKDVIFTRHVFEEIAGLFSKGSTEISVTGSASPTVCAIDSQSIKDLVCGISGKGKALKSYNRTISYLRSAKDLSLIKPIGVPTAEQQADILTKQYKSPTEYWKAAVGPLGEHPAIDDMLDRVIAQHGRSGRKLRSETTLSSQTSAEREDSSHSVNNINVDSQYDATSIFNALLDIESPDDVR